MRIFFLDMTEKRKASENAGLEYDPSNWTNEATAYAPEKHDALRNGIAKYLEENYDFD